MTFLSSSTRPRRYPAPPSLPGAPVATRRPRRYPAPPSLPGAPVATRRPRRYPAPPSLPGAPVATRRPRRYPAPPSLPGAPVATRRPRRYPAPPSLPGAPVATRRVVFPIVVFRVTCVNLKKFRLCEAKKKKFPPPKAAGNNRREKGGEKRRKSKFSIRSIRRDFTKSRSHLLPGTSKVALHLMPFNRPVKREPINGLSNHRVDPKGPFVPICDTSPLEPPAFSGSIGGGECVLSLEKSRRKRLTLNRS